VLENKSKKREENIKSRIRARTRDSKITMRIV
jgi:hypothetical protein